MLNEKMLMLLNQQINAELTSAYIYLAFADRMQETGLEGFAHWYQVQADEELEHADRITKYIHDNGKQVDLAAIQTPQSLPDTVEGILEAGLSHEKYITNLIHLLCDEAAKISDYRTMRFLGWFVDEQAEEEKNAQDLICRMELFGKDCAGLYELNKELGKR